VSGSPFLRFGGHCGADFIDLLIAAEVVARKAVVLSDISDF
jgi:hypothetical protein